MYVSIGTATLVNCVLEGNSADYGGGMFVAFGTATLYGCTFTSNTASSNGADIFMDGGAVSVNGCAAGYAGGTPGNSLSTAYTDGIITGTPNSFSGCTECAR